MLDSGWQPTWWCRVSPLEHWESRFSSLALLIHCLPFSSSICSELHRCASSQHSAPAMACARWSYQDTFLDITASKSVSRFDSSRRFGAILYIGDMLKASNSRILQYPCMRRMVRCQCHSRRPTSECSQRRRSRIRRHHYHRSMHILDHALRIQGCSHVRDVLLDSLFYRFPHRPWRIRTFRSFSEFDHAHR